MNKQAKDNDALKAIIKKPITEIACPSFSFGKKEFFYNILYNIACEDNRSSLPNILDVFVHASAKEFCSNPAIKDPAHKYYGYGGEPISTIVNLFYDMNIEGFVMLNKKKSSNERVFHNFALIDQKHKFLDINTDFIRNVYGTEIDENFEMEATERKCCIYLPQFPLTGAYSDINSKLFFYNEFSLLFGIITFNGLEKETNKTIGHTLLGLICNDIYIIYDSYKNEFIDFDWTKVVANGAKISQIFSSLYENDLVNLGNFRIELALYINKKDIGPISKCQV
jgi:hypothetical protein